MLKALPDLDKRQVVHADIFNADAMMMQTFFIYHATCLLIINDNDKILNFVLLMVKPVNKHAIVYINPSKPSRNILAKLNRPLLWAQENKVHNKC